MPALIERYLDANRRSVPTRVSLWGWCNRCDGPLERGTGRCERCDGEEDDDG